MSALDMADYETILAIVRDWPPEQRVILVREVLQSLAPAGTDGRPARETLARARGLLRSDQPPPSDSEIARWLDERRTARYGR